ncbi:clostripain-related cysteine peptidase [Parapedobacter pyrenivorans]|uniref:clostripain-related cysteine peptidase n=1 Tax=Parapedobacter pyrenivorans TaxID=1305674 RepID=UPI001E453E79|nr:clostripain-related cysteine peptidase [Parapedobacter pyrenivorans]
MITILLSLIVSCDKDDKVRPELPNRTILYYLGADNNLHVEADEKIEALRLGFPGGDNRLVIYKDIPNNVPQLLEIYADKTGENQIRIIKGYPEQNEVVAGDIQLLLDDIQQLFPAKSYGLILFSHASGWLPQGTLTQPETALLRMGRSPIRTYTIAMDGTSELGLREFAAAIPDHFFDFIAFEACFMAGIEVLYELKDKTDYILSSSAEVVSPGFAPVYPNALQRLFEPRADVVAFAQAYFDFWNDQIGDYRSATITVTKTAGLQPLATWIRQYGIAARSPIDLPDVQHFDRYSNHRLFFDFGDYCRRMVEPAAESRLNDLLNDVVVYKAATPFFIPSRLGFEINRHSGITTYIRQERFPKLDERYDELAWSIFLQNNQQ